MKTGNSRIEEKGKRNTGNGGKRRDGAGRPARRAALAACAMAVVLSAGCGRAVMDNIFDSAFPPELGGVDYNGVASGKGTGNFGGSAVTGGVQAAESVKDVAPGESGGADVTAGRKLIDTVRMEVETKEFDRMLSSLDAQIRGLGGYVESMSTYHGSSYTGNPGNRYANLVIRIPGPELDGFLSAVSDAGNVVRQSKERDDVTLSYVDMESHRNALRTEQERLLSFLERAETIEEIITIESRLSDVRYQLESMESRLRTLDNQIEYSTVHMDISEVREWTPVAEQTVGERISEGFLGSLRNVGNGFMEFGIWIVVNSPYLAIWAAVIAGIALFARRCYKQGKAKQDARRREAQEKMKAAMEERNTRNGG